MIKDSVMSNLFCERRNNGLYVVGWFENNRRLAFIQNEAGAMRFCQGYGVQFPKPQSAVDVKVKQLRGVLWRTGWEIAKLGGLECDCKGCPDTIAGWWASHDADAALRRVGVRGSVEV